MAAWWRQEAGRPGDLDDVGNPGVAVVRATILHDMALGRRMTKKLRKGKLNRFREDPPEGAPHCLHGVPFLTSMTKLQNKTPLGEI